MRFTCIGAALLVTLAGTACTGGDGAASPPLDGTAPANPTGDVGDASKSAVRVRRADFSVQYELEGQTGDGDVVWLVDGRQFVLRTTLDAGAEVTRDQQLGRTAVRDDVRNDLQATASTSRIDRARLAALEESTGPVEGPLGGQLALDDGAAGIRSRGVDVVVPLTPLQLLRYRSMSFQGTATVETVVGIREVDCVHTWVEAAAGGIAAGGEDGSAAVRCRLPATVETVAGLRASLTLMSETIRDATIVPNMFIGTGADEDGYVMRVRDGGTAREVPVDVGVTDGVVRVITSELEEGLVLLPVDGTADDQSGDGASEDGADG